MKPSDITSVLNGLEMVARALVNQNKSGINKIMKNSSITTISKSLMTSMEDKLSSGLTYSGKKDALINLSTEIKERSWVVAESVKQYSVFVMNQNSALPKNEIDSDFEINHPIIKDEISSSVLEEVNLRSINESNLQHTVPSSESKYTLDTPVASEEIIMPTYPAYSEISKSAQPASSPKEFLETAFKPPKNIKSHKLSELSDRARERKVPASQISRLLSYGGLAAGMGVGAAAEVIRRKILPKTGKSLEMNSLLSENPFLSEANANRIVDTLCKVRGAALKLGQMLSIQDNAMINPQLAAVFERVRQSADFMPAWQMERVLIKEWGESWRDKLSEFNSKPFAAASIGQVHHAKLLDGTDVALKIQYPGVAQGIESDIKSLMSIVNFWNILPKGLYVDNVMSVAKRELKKEVNYRHEAESGKKFKKLLESYPEFLVPHVYQELCTSNILTTELVYGTPIDKFVNEDQDLRNKICERLLRLCLMEIFVFRFMQTDPNWSNFLYNYETDQIVLLDFGACNEYTQEFVDVYMNIIKASADQNREKVLHFSQELGFLSGYETKIMEEAHVDSVLILGEAFACKKVFDFKQQNLTQRIHHLVPIMLKHRLTPPPEETYSLHRKMSGIFLLCTKLGAKLDCSKLFDEVHALYVATKV